MAPAPVDHDIRRAELSRAVVELVADGGLDAVSVRAVAANAGVSIGTVQHYFPTKDAMLAHAHALVNVAVSARAEGAANTAASPRAALRAIILAVLPTDPESARIVRVFSAFETRALHAPALAEQARSESAALHTAIEQLLRLGGAEHPRLDAIGTIALMGGLCQPLLLDDPACTRRDAVAVVDLHVDRVLPPQVESR
jgi:TetR/AcrR family transcriptional regulator, transcriptional repressor of bet genes